PAIVPIQSGACCHPQIWIEGCPGEPVLYTQHVHLHAHTVDCADPIHWSVSIPVGDYVVVIPQDQTGPDLELWSPFGSGHATVRASCGALDCAATSEPCSITWYFPCGVSLRFAQWVFGEIGAGQCRVIADGYPEHGVYSWTVDGAGIIQNPVVGFADGEIGN